MSQATIASHDSSKRGRPRWSDTRWAAAVCVGLVVGVALVYGQTLRYGFVTFDDSIYVYDEPHVTGGLSWSSVVWAFAKGPSGDWCPSAMLSHMLDCQLYGLNPGGHHFTNLLLHAASAVTLFLVLRRMTAALWPSALVAALFGLHPLRVESVAWIAERRDVLSGLFFMLTLGAYGEYVRRPQSLARYLAVAVLLALGLSAKSMLVTLPALLMLLDFWPLERFGWPAGTGAEFPWPPFPRRIVWEKLPLLALSLAEIGMTLSNHRIKGPSPLLTLSERLANAAVSCVTYLGQLFVPVGLSVFYPFPAAGRPVWQTATATALLLAITVAAIACRRSRPHLFVGWFWYLGMLLPVLEVIPVGVHARADRYSYLPQIGIYLALVWEAARLTAAWPARRWILGVGSALVLAMLMACAWRQTGYWRSSQTLWTRALDCDPANIRARCGLAAALEEEEKDDAQAAAQYQLVLETEPAARDIYRTFRAEAHIGLGNIALRREEVTDAGAHFAQALQLFPNSGPAHMNLGLVLARQRDFDGAIAHFQRTAELAPRLAVSAHCNLAAAHLRQGKTQQAIADLNKAIEINPDSKLARTDLATLLANSGDVDGAISQCQRLIQIDPALARPYRQIADLLRRQGKLAEAVPYDERGAQATRRYVKAQNSKGIELLRAGERGKAIARFRTALEAAPNDPESHCNLAEALAAQGNFDQAIEQYNFALAIDPNLVAAKRGLEKLSKTPTDR